MKKMSFCLFVFVFNLSLFAQWTTIKNGALWKDTQGSAVQAHGAGFLQVGNKWYMVGEDRSYSNAGVNLYSTSDFVSWKFEKKIIPPSAYRSDRFIERPKLLRCPSTGRFVVWCHYEGANYAPSEAASFVCDSVNGLYTLSFSGRPFNIASRDCNVFVDNDGKGYFVSTTDGNSNLTLFELSEDYLTPVKSTRLSAFNGKGREAPAIVRINNTYFLISSKCTGWDPNQATISYSSSLTSGWTTMTNIGNGISFDTQAASILTVQGTSGTSYLYVGDRWQDPNLANSKTIIFPISFSGNTCTFNYRQQFDVDFTTGLTRETPVTNRLSKTSWKIRSYSSQETSNESGAAANAIDGNTSTRWHTKYSGTVASAPHFIEVDMGGTYPISGFLCAPRLDNTNGLIREFILTVSTDATNWTAVAGGNWMPYYSEIYFQPIQARYFRLTSLSGTFASITELDMLQSTPAYTEQTISPYYQSGPIVSGNWKSGSNITINKGNCLNFGPTTTGGGSWAWYGPLEQMFADRQISIPNIDVNQAGKYTAFFLNQYNCVSHADFTVNISVDITSAKRKLQNTVTKAQKNLFTGIKGNDELSALIADAQTLLQNSSATFDQLDNKTKEVKRLVKNHFDQIVTGSVNVTSNIITPNNFTSISPVGWSGTALSSVGNECGEFSNKVFDFNQTIGNLSNGYYLVGVQALYRPGANDGGNNYSNGIEPMNVTLYANDKSVPVSSVYNLPFKNDNSLYGYCNDTISASAAFSADNANFANWVIAEVKDGTLKIGLKKSLSVSNDWCCFNNFSLYKLGDALMGVDDVFIDPHKINGTVFSVDGRYIGSGTLESLHLKQGFYISDGQKFYVK